jgi:hypothetical protein
MPLTIGNFARSIAVDSAVSGADQQSGFLVDGTLLVAGFEAEGIYRKFGGWCKLQIGGHVGGHPLELSVRNGALAAYHP